MAYFTQNSDKYESLFTLSEFDMLVEKNHFIYIIYTRDT